MLKDSFQVLSFGHRSKYNFSVGIRQKGMRNSMRKLLRWDFHSGNYFNDFSKRYREKTKKIIDH
eukprot:UN28562